MSYRGLGVLRLSYLYMGGGGSGTTAIEDVLRISRVWGKWLRSTVVFHILQISLFCVQQMTEIYTGSEQ